MGNNSYSTTLSGTENPLSEGGVWVDGGVNSDRTSVQKGALPGGGNGAFGTQIPASAPPFNDSVSILTGFSADHSAQGKIAVGTTSNDIEIEFHLRSEVTANHFRGYELNFYKPTTKFSIVRSNGPADDFTFLADNIFTNVTINDGDSYFAKIVGNIITVTVNGTQIEVYDLSNDDFIWGRGNPGMGFYRDTSLGTPSAANTLAFDTFQANSLGNDPWQFVSANSTKTKTVTLNAIAGNLLVVGFDCNDSTSTPTISDGVNVWTPVSASPVKDTTNNVSVSMWSAVAATTTALTITITATPTTFNGTWIQQWSGNALTNVNCGSAGTPNITGSTTKNAIQTGAFTPTANGCLILSFVADGGGAPTAKQFNAGTSPVVFTKELSASQDPAGASDATYAVSDTVQTSAVSINPTWTETVATAVCGISAAFRVAPSVAQALPIPFAPPPGLGTPYFKRWTWDHTLEQNIGPTVQTATITETLGVYSWKGTSSSLSKEIISAIGNWTWVGKTSPLSKEIVAIKGQYTWVGKTSPLSSEIVLTTGKWTWLGTSSPISKSISSSSGAWSWKGLTSTFGSIALITETIGAYSWSGKQSTLSKMLNEILGPYTWSGIHATITTGGTGSTVVFFDGINVGDGLTYHKGLSRPHITLISAGGGTFTVTKDNQVTEEKSDSILKETYLIDGDIP